MPVDKKAQEHFRVVTAGDQQRLRTRPCNPASTAPLHNQTAPCRRHRPYQDANRSFALDVGVMPTRAINKRSRIDSAVVPCGHTDRPLLAVAAGPRLLGNRYCVGFCPPNVVQTGQTVPPTNRGRVMLVSRIVAFVVFGFLGNVPGVLWVPVHYQWSIYLCAAGQLLGLVPLAIWGLPDWPRRLEARSQHGAAEQGWRTSRS